MSHPVQLALSILDAAGNGTKAPAAVPKAWKIGIIPALFVITLVPSIGPWFMMCFCSKKRLALTFSFAGCFASGILLGAGLGNILPEAIENWSDYFARRGIDNRLSGFPFAPAIAGLVVLLMVSLEHLLVTAGASHSHTHGDASDDEVEEEEPPGEHTPIVAASLKHKKKKKKKHKHGEDGKEPNGKMPEHAVILDGHKPHEHPVPEWHNQQEHHHHQRRIITGI